MNDNNLPVRDAVPNWLWSSTRRLILAGRVSTPLMSAAAISIVESIGNVPVRDLEPEHVDKVVSDAEAAYPGRGPLMTVIMQLFLDYLIKADLLVIPGLTLPSWDVRGVLSVQVEDIPQVFEGFGEKDAEEAALLIGQWRALTSRNELDDRSLAECPAT